MPTPSAKRADEAGRRPGGRKSQRADILDAAVALFAKGGSKGTSLAAIAARIGVTVPAIVHHFGTREALLREVVAVTEERLDEGGRLSVPPADGLRSLENLRTWPRLLLGDPSMANLSRLSALMAAEAVDTEYPSHDHFVARRRRFQQSVAALIARGQQEGTIRPDVRPDLIANELVSFMQGAQLQWFLDPEGVDLEAVFTSYLDRLLREITQSGPSARTKRSAQ